MRLRELEERLRLIIEALEEEVASPAMDALDDLRHEIERLRVCGGDKEL